MPRKIETPYTVDMLQSVIDRLDRLSGRLRAVRQWIEDEGLEELPITNHRSMVQGVEFAEAFGQAAERAVDDFRIGQVQARRRDQSDSQRSEPNRAADQAANQAGS